MLIETLVIIILQLDTLDRSQLAARLTLNCSDNYVEPQKLKDVYVTIIDVSKLNLHVHCDQTYYRTCLCALCILGSTALRWLELQICRHTPIHLQVHSCKFSIIICIRIYITLLVFKDIQP